MIYLKVISDRHRHRETAYQAGTFHSVKELWSEHYYIVLCCNTMLQMYLEPYSGLENWNHIYYKLRHTSLCLLPVPTNGTWLWQPVSGFSGHVPYHWRHRSGSECHLSGDVNRCHINHILKTHLKKPLWLNHVFWGLWLIYKLGDNVILFWIWTNTLHLLL